MSVLTLLAGLVVIIAAIVAILRKVDVRLALLLAALALGALMMGALYTHVVNAEFSRLIPPLVLGGLAFLVCWSQSQPPRQRVLQEPLE